MLKAIFTQSYILIFVLIATYVLGQDPMSNTSVQDSIFPLDFSFYKNRYSEKDLLCKITDNSGDGCDILYGTRNMRAILHGIAYRGGANNYFHKTNKRRNSNPLPDDGVKNLCSEGFSHAVYLYRVNAESMDSVQACDCIKGDSSTMKYSQLDYFDTTHIRNIIQMVYEAGVNDDKGPVYLHCWNGWHASGYISAVLLKQFCGYDEWQAVNYWDLGTDGVNKNERYQKIRKMIKNFKPYPQYQFHDTLGNLVCPSMPEVIDSSKLYIGLEHLVLVPEAIPIDYRIVLHNISFGAGESSFSNIHRNRDVKMLLKALKTHPELSIEIAGYTDNSGSSSKNKALSQKRAKFIYDYLLKQGISSTQISYKGYGEQRPIYSNRYSSTRKKNRRIEVKLLKNISFVK
ncbi:MAG: OmpA family protein [Aureispira sp.]|nr:OmpA family protein [Aureispira sp.]